MAIDIMDALVNFLCPTSQSAMACNQFINTPHHQVLAPVGPLLYFFLFPTIFLIIFIYILSTSVLRGPTGTIKGVRILIAAGVYIFIIINGWYSIVLPLAEIWFIILPLLGILYFIVRHFTGGGGGQGGGMSLVGGGIVGKLVRRGYEKGTGMEEADAKYIESQIAIIETAPKGAHGIDVISGRVIELLREFRDKTSAIPGVPFASDYNKLLDRYKKACSKKGLPVSKDLKKMKKAA